MQLLNKELKLDTFILIDEINNNNLIDKLLEIIYKNNTYYHKPTNVIAKHTEFDFLNNNNYFHLFLKQIKKQLYLICKENFYVEASWANIYNKDDYAKMHNHHGSTAFSGILYLTDGPGPGTYFPEYDLNVEEKKGRFVIFHGHLFHEVKKFTYNKDRVTIAFNCCKVGFLEKDIKIEYKKL